MRKPAGTTSDTEGKGRRKAGESAAAPDPDPASAILLSATDSMEEAQALLVFSEESSESLEWGYAFPPAEELKRFSEIDPELPKKLLDQCLAAWDAESRHRRRWEWAVLLLDFWPVAAGQILAFLLALFVFKECAGLIRGGHSVVGLAGILTQVAALVAVFFWGRKGQRQEKAGKSQKPETG